jgi:phosphatidylglycerol---prolipoprotein diacylglyceryl transferase
MHPRLFTTPWFTLHTYGALLALSYLAALLMLKYGARREGLDGDKAVSLGLWAIIGAIAGAKLMMMVRSVPEYLADPSQLWSLSTLQSAGDFYGGFIGALLASYIFFSRHPEFPAWKTADLCGPAIALGQSIGRLGCLSAGCCYGSSCSLPWAVTFNDPEVSQIGGAPLGIGLHPVQAYESLACFLIFLFLIWLARRKRFDGEIVLAYTFLYAVARFYLEFFRGDEDRGHVLGGALSTSQFVAVFAVAASVILFSIRHRIPRTPNKKRGSSIRVGR